MEQILEHMARGMSDEVSSWHLQPDGTWLRVSKDASGQPLVDIQDETMKKIVKRPKVGSGV